MTIKEFFSEHRRVALAFSGGVDSAYLLYAACSFGCDITAYYVKSQFQPQFESEDALRLADSLKARIKVLNIDILSDATVSSNPADRCYHCKKRIFSAICDAAHADGYDLIIDGTNASDDAADRPGMKALEELAVRSPLRECGLTKTDIRQYSREAGLFTWNKPAYACLATRIPAGSVITSEKLRITELAEKELADLGFTDFRIRQINNSARIQVHERQFREVFEKRELIYHKLKPYYQSITLDLEGRK